MPGHSFGQEFNFEGGSTMPGPDVMRLQFERQVTQALAGVHGVLNNIDRRVAALEGKPVLPLQQQGGMGDFVPQAPPEEPEAPNTEEPEQEDERGTRRKNPIRKEKVPSVLEPIPGLRVWRCVKPHDGPYVLIQPFKNPPGAGARLSMPGDAKNEYRVEKLEDAWVMAEPRTGNLVVRPIALFTDEAPRGVVMPAIAGFLSRVTAAQLAAIATLILSGLALYRTFP